ncbi:hypothetical protein [Streptomyces griseoruber]|uniref:hypothetical protein n=1 Tax=Streptomyces griseoruber TaxID=1943 RepID=UPI001F0AC7E3|nr:hypothetical protein [Streptomyces griseoruber]
MTERVLEIVRRDPEASALPYLLPYVNVPWVEGGVARPMAEDELAEAVFPSGRPLPPSLRAWLAYDTGLLERHGWFAPDGSFAPRPLDELVGDEMGDFWGNEFGWLSGRLSECFLLPGGSDSRRILAVTEPDQEGEYPVLALDLDDMPYLGLMYPGFDVYLADTAGLLDLGGRKTYTDLIDHAVYGPRMRRHAAQCFAGEACVEYPFEFTAAFAQLHPERAEKSPRRGGSAR